MKYTLGLDLGIASVGWCVINWDPKRIEDLGVRLFDKAETPKDGSSLALPRREARSARRRLRRKRLRIQEIRNLLVDSEVISMNEIDSLFSKAHEKSPWQLRYEALDRALEGNELSRILIHLAKRRGFKSNRRTENENKNSDEGKLLAGVKLTGDLLESGEYRTIGEMVWKDPEFGEHIRNRRSSYRHAFLRKNIEDEIATIFSRQRELGSSICGKNFEKKYKDIWGRQRPFSDHATIEKMVGKCTFEPDEKRGPKASATFERFQMLEKINRMRIGRNWDKRELTTEERNECIKTALELNKVSYTQLRKRLNLDSEDTFNLVNYSRAKGVDDSEKVVFLELKYFHTLKKAVQKRLGREKWTEIEVDEELMNNIGYGVTFMKTDEELSEFLKGEDVSKEWIDVALDMPSKFSGVGHLSLKAMQKIIPHLKAGENYTEACRLAGYESKVADKKSMKLPAIPADEIRNPVVIRALSQARKVVNAVISRYGSPCAIHVEMAREMTLSYTDRLKLIGKQRKDREQREISVEKIREIYGYDSPKGGDVLKFRLYNEQSGRCAYSLKPIDPMRVLEDGYCEIDHVIPFSRSYDNSYFNKVLVLTAENRDKSNRIPAEWFGADEQRWHEFSEKIKSMHLPFPKLNRLLSKKLSPDHVRELKERNLNDTRYIARFMKEYIKENIEFHPEAPGKQHVFTMNGSVTAFLRARWGLTKDREEGPFHHILDAAVVAAADRACMMRVESYYKYRELRDHESQKTVTDMTTGEVIAIEEMETRFPEPWEGFRIELLGRLSADPKAEMLNQNLETYSLDYINTLKPVFPSVMPRRRHSGQAHKDTIRSAKLLKTKDKVTYVKRQLSSLTKSDVKTLEEMKKTPLYASDHLLYDAVLKELRKWTDSNIKPDWESFRKPKANGDPGPKVFGIKIASKEGISGIPIRKGIAGHAEMVRVDVFRKDKA
ncbi:MAG TPA: type II CRISPR RNA-guided endonuclease Cas9, partial [Desulfobacteraceae bacterium]|nr:type II CRISPR RNA-guided endonuclease Cas9 [Desulfobacteraceae bacterium]